jgi:hypothetical protein
MVPRRSSVCYAITGQLAPMLTAAAARIVRCEIAAAILHLAIPSVRLMDVVTVAAHCSNEPRDPNPNHHMQ